MAAGQRNTAGSAAGQRKSKLTKSTEERRAGKEEAGPEIARCYRGSTFSLSTTILMKQLPSASSESDVTT